MEIVIRICCDNAAFEEEDWTAEVARILQRYARRINGVWEASDLPCKLADTNGNTVGSVEVVP